MMRTRDIHQANAMRKTHVSSNLRGVSKLAIAAVAQVTHLVEALHHTILRVPGVFGEEVRGPASGITGFVYRSIRGVNALVGSAIDGVLAELEPVLGARAPTMAGEAAQAALNGVLGDYLAETGNPLAITMQLRSDGRALPMDAQALRDALPAVTGKIALLVHGLCMNDLQWQATPASDANDGEAKSSLAVSLSGAPGYTVLYLHYNSGLHISANGRAFADLLETLAKIWPVRLSELTIVAHSMGGLVARSACHYAALAHHGWLQHLRALIFLGTPHHGAPLERGGNWIDVILGVSPYSAPFARLGKMRSAGITDLRYGNLVDEDWAGQDRFERIADRREHVALPEGVRCHAIAATTGKAPGGPGDRLPGDGLVPVDSALGRHPQPGRSVLIPKSRQWIGYGMGHLDLLTAPAVHAQITRWLEVS